MIGIQLAIPCNTEDEQVPAQRDMIETSGAWKLSLYQPRLDDKLKTVVHLGRPELPFLVVKGAVPSEPCSATDLFWTASAEISLCSKCGRVETLTFPSSLLPSLYITGWWFGTCFFPVY